MGVNERGVGGWKGGLMEKNEGEKGYKQGERVT